MEFWGEEVKSGEPLKVSLVPGSFIHLSQACLGELKKGKGNESVYLYVNVDGYKLVLGTLSGEKLPQQQLDLLFDRDFELSHSSKTGKVYFYGYRNQNAYDVEFSEDLDSDDFESDEDEDVPLTVANNGKPESKAKQEKPADAAKGKTAKGKDSEAAKQKVKIVESIKDVKPNDGDESSDEDLMSEDDDEVDSQDEEDSDDESEESDEETPKKAKAEPSKKRPAESSTKTPLQTKKAKVTPQKNDVKNVSGHVATPHPTKQAGKTPAANKPNQQTPKSGGALSCKTCNRTFVSEQGLESHTKAKHSVGK